MKNRDVYDAYMNMKNKSMQKLAAELGITPQRISQIVKRLSVADSCQQLLDLLVSKFEMKDFSHEQMNALDLLQKYCNEVSKTNE